MERTHRLLFNNNFIIPGLVLAGEMLENVDNDKQCFIDIRIFQSNVPFKNTLFSEQINK